MDDTHKPAVAITMGDPCGIGPEVVVKALADPWVYTACRPRVVGNTFAMERALALTGLDLRITSWKTRAPPAGTQRCWTWWTPRTLIQKTSLWGRISPQCGKAAMEWVTKAGELALAGTVAALATAPLNKEAASLAGFQSIGHMELLQELSGAKNRGHHVDGQEPSSGASHHPPVLTTGLRLCETGADSAISPAYPRQLCQMGDRPPKNRSGRAQSPRERWRLAG